MTNLKTTILAASAFIGFASIQASAHPGSGGGHEAAHVNVGVHASVGVHGAVPGVRGGFVARPGYVGGAYGYRYGYYAGARGYWGPNGVWVATCAPVFGGYDAYGNAIWNNVCD